MTDQTQPAKIWERRNFRLAAAFAAVALIAFAAGFVPMWLQTRKAYEARQHVQRTLKVVQLENSIGAAAIDSRRGDYEPARQSMSRFFTDLRQELDLGPKSAFTPRQQAALKPLLNPRDQIITLLARSDPAAADRLSDLYVLYRKAMAAP